MHWSIKLLIVFVVVFNIDVPNSFAASNQTDINLTNLNAQFETTECALPCKKFSASNNAANKKTTWWMWRTPHQVELKKPMRTPMRTIVKCGKWMKTSI